MENQTYTVKLSDDNGTVDLETFDSLEDAEEYAKNEADTWTEEYSCTIEVWNDENEVVSEYEALEVEPEPDCKEGGHNWESPHEVLGGLEENPGVRGNGGGVIVKEICRCGLTKVTDTWASHPLYPAIQGHTKVSYNDDLSYEIEEYYREKD